MRQLSFTLAPPAGGASAPGYQLVSDAGGFLICWGGVEVVRASNERFAHMVLAVLEEMGDPRAWRGVFSNDLQRRINRLMRVVPCSRCGAGACVRPSGHLTDLEKPHEERRRLFDKWLSAE